MSYLAIKHESSIFAEIVKLLAARAFSFEKMNGLIPRIEEMINQVHLVNQEKKEDVFLISETFSGRVDSFTQEKINVKVIERYMTLSINDFFYFKDEKEIVLIKKYGNEFCAYIKDLLNGKAYLIHDDAYELKYSDTEYFNILDENNILLSLSGDSIFKIQLVQDAYEHFEYKEKPEKLSNVIKMKSNHDYVNFIKQEIKYGKPSYYFKLKNCQFGHITYYDGVWSGVSLSNSVVKLLKFNKNQDKLLTTNFKQFSHYTNEQIKQLSATLEKIQEMDILMKDSTKIKIVDYNTIIDTCKLRLQEYEDQFYQIPFEVYKDVNYIQQQMHMGDKITPVNIFSDLDSLFYRVSTHEIESDFSLLQPLLKISNTINKACSLFEESKLKTHCKI